MHCCIYYCYVTEFPKEGNWEDFSKGPPVPAEIQYVSYPCPLQKAATPTAVKPKVWFS